MIHHWKHLPSYASDETYKAGMDWLAECRTVEDWGCALMYAKKFRVGEYVGIDGMNADVNIDLNKYRSKVDGVFMRHVLEHNLDWRVVLQNALASFQKRMALIMFLPPTTKDGIPTPGKIPTIHLNWIDLRSMLGTLVKHESVVANKLGPYETVFLLEK